MVLGSEVKAAGCRLPAAAVRDLWLGWVWICRGGVQDGRARARLLVRIGNMGQGRVRSARCLDSAAHVTLRARLMSDRLSLRGKG